LIKVINHKGIELCVGDKIKIISDKINNRTLVTVELNEIITISAFSDNGKILYHHNSLALPVNSDVYLKLENNYE
jgi:hypothetical protein